MPFLGWRFLDPAPPPPPPPPPRSHRKRLAAMDFNPCPCIKCKKAWPPSLPMALEDSNKCRNVVLPTKFSAIARAPEAVITLWLRSNVFTELFMVKKYVNTRASVLHKWQCDNRTVAIVVLLHSALDNDANSSRPGRPCWMSIVLLGYVPFVIEAAMEERSNDTWGT